MKLFRYTYKVAFKLKDTEIVSVKQSPWSDMSFLEFMQTEYKFILKDNDKIDEPVLIEEKEIELPLKEVT